jgi:5'-nucleotidase
MKHHLRTLVTNDDGIDSAGIRVLAAAAHRHGLDVTVAAPLIEASGSAASMIATEREGRVVVEERKLRDLPDVRAYAVAASPGFIVTIAGRGAFGKPPELVLSGINRGANTGRAVLHSGTVGAALTGSLNGCRAMAFSLDVGLDPQHCYWDTAGEVAGQLLPLVTATDELSVISVNVPNLPADQTRGMRQAKLTRYGSVQMTLAEVGEGFIRTTVGADESMRLAEQSEPGSDLALLARGYVTVTALRPYCEAMETELPLPAMAGADRA